jgi:hypothetical protein
MTDRAPAAAAWGIVVPGSGRLEADGCYRIGARALECVRTAARLAERRTPRVVVFSGWSPVTGPTEAEQMRAAWDGPPDIDLVVEASATITAENMSRSLPHILERGVHEVTVVCGTLHLPRVRYYFGGVYPRHGVRCSYVRTRQAPTPAALGREAAALVLMRRQRRAAIAEIANFTSEVAAYGTAVTVRGV